MTALNNYTNTAYLSYSMSVITDRAIPSCTDGMKPVHRRILFAMDEMRLRNSTHHVKSARVVGEVIGKFHPHGDVAVYDAMVRMAQDFSLRYPIVDGQGNFGSRDGDSAAAMRYTEARLLPISELLLGELGEDTVDFRDNYDASVREPVVLPARLPFVLLNGATGIAVGMSTDIPSHNLVEVANAAIALLEAPDLSDDAIYKIVPAPDFPTGAQIITPAAVIAGIYASGRGSVRVRARWEIEHLAKGDYRIVISELPPNVSSAMVLTEIENLVNPQASRKQPEKRRRGSPEAPLKAALMGMIDGIRDESGKGTAVRLVIEPKTRKVDSDAIMALLLANTSLETNVSVNLTVIDPDGNAACLSVATILRHWVTFRLETVRRRCQYRLRNLEHRIHILEGRKLAIANIDEVIAIIRGSDNPKVALIARFGFSDIQVEDVLDMQLRRLSRLVDLEIDRELDERNAAREQLVFVLAHDEALRALVVSEIASDRDTYGDERRTVLEESVASSPTKINLPVVNDPVTVILSRNGWVRTRSGHDVDIDSLAFKNGDGYRESFTCLTSDTLVLLDSGGNAYNVAVAAIPGGKGDGVSLASLIELAAGNTVSAITAIGSSPLFLLASSGGYGFVTTPDNLTTRRKSGKVLLTPTGDSVMMLPLSTPEQHIAIESSEHRLLVISASELPQLPRGKGVKLISLAGDATIVNIAPLPSTRFALSADALLECIGKRGSKGKPVKLSRRQLRLLD